MKKEGSTQKMSLSLSQKAHGADDGTWQHIVRIEFYVFKPNMTRYFCLLINTGAILVQ